MKNPLHQFILLLLVSASAVHGQIALQPLTTFGTNGDGTVRPGDYYFLTSAGQFQRGMAYNPATGHILIVDRSTNTPTSANNDVYILDGTTGLALTNLDGTFRKLDNSSTIAGGNASFTLNHIGIADDGSIYVVNLSSASFPIQTRVYRWENEEAAQSFVYVGDPSNGTSSNTAGPRRWGDTMAVRGAGINTQILIANRGNSVALITPDDSSLATFSARTLITDAPIGGFSIGLSFGEGNTFWGTSGGFNNGPLLHMQFDASAGTATTLTNFSPSVFPGTISPLLVIPSSNLLAGITMVSGADVVRLYDITNTNSPVLLDRQSFVTANNNGNFAGALALGNNGVLYALDSDNGLLAFTFVNAAPAPLGPAFFLNPATQLAIAGNAVTLTAAADGNAPITYQWSLNGTNILGETNTFLTFTNVQVTDAGSYTVVASNAVTNVTSSAAVLTVAATPPTSLLVSDSIPYAPGSNISGQGKWSSPAVTQTNTFKATNGNLQVTGLAAAQDNMITWPLTPAASIRITNGVTTASGPIYASFAYRIDNLGSLAAGGAGSTVAGFVPDFTGSTYSTKVDVRKDASGTGFNIGAFKGTGETTGSFATNILDLGQTVFVVARYTFGDSGTTTAADDACAIWINPNSSTFGLTNPPPESIPDFGIGAADIAQIVGFALRTSGGPSLSYADEIRVGLTWADVTPLPSVSPVLKIARVNATSVLLSWPSAATGFNLEGASSLTTPIGWATVTNSTIVIGTNNTVSVTVTNGNQFFRLRK